MLLFVMDCSISALKVLAFLLIISVNLGFPGGSLLFILANDVEFVDSICRYHVCLI